jgi:hypothetical protein
MVKTEIDSQFIKEHLDIKDPQSASGTINTMITQIPFYEKMIPIQPDVEKSLKSAIIKIGLITMYALENSKLKPPFTKDNPYQDWDLDEATIAEIKKSLTPEILEAAQKHINNQEVPETTVESFPKLITAIAYLKTKPYFEGKTYQATTDEQAKYE